MGIRIEKVPYSEFKKIKPIRKQVFVELGIGEEHIFDSDDLLCDQILIRLDDVPIGSARIRYEETTARIERMGILKEYRNKGYGKISLENIIQYCKARNVNKIILDSIYAVRLFYGKCGFVEQGIVFSKVGIPHMTMYLDLV